jgi:UDP-glucuronate 4-epimerase
MSKQTILVTGGAGFIGSYVARELLARGDDVVIIDNFHEYYPRKAKEFNLDLIRLWCGQKVEKSNENEIVPVFEKFKEFYNWNKSSKKGKMFFFEGDIRDRGLLKKIFSKHKIDKVMHLAAMAGVDLSVSEPYLYTDVNVLGTVALLDECLKNNVKKFVFGSSSSVYGSRNKIPFYEEDDTNEPCSPYAATKRMSEILNHTYHELYGISIINARIFGPIYGPLQRPYRMINQRFINKAYHGEKLPIYGDGKEGGRDTTYVDDEVDGLLKCLDSDIDFGTINIGSGKVVTPIEVAESVIKFIGKGEIDLQPRPKGEAPITYADTKLAKKLLDFSAKWDFENGLKRQIEVFLLMPKWYKKMPC